VWRTVLVVLAFAVMIFLTIQWLWKDDTDAVEARIEHLLEVARQGGEGAAAEIIDALADDYDGGIGRKSIEQWVRNIVGNGKVRTLTTGDYDVVSKADGIVVPIFRIDLETSSRRAAAVFVLTFALRDGDWKVTSVDQWRFGR